MDRRVEFNRDLDEMKRKRRSQASSWTRSVQSALAMSPISSRTTLTSAIFLMSTIALVSAKPLVDPGVFVIEGVRSCRNGAGYCVLGTKCTIDKDFVDDDDYGHCDGLRNAFSPSAMFVCCKYVGEEADAVSRIRPEVHSPSPAPVDNFFFEKVGDSKNPGAVVHLVEVLDVVTDSTGVLDVVTRPFQGTQEEFLRQPPNLNRYQPKFNVTWLETHLAAVASKTKHKNSEEIDSNPEGSSFASTFQHFLANNNVRKVRSAEAFPKLSSKKKTSLKPHLNHGFILTAIKTEKRGAAGGGSILAEGKPKVGSKVISEDDGHTGERIVHEVPLPGSSDPVKTDPVLIRFPDDTVAADDHEADPSLPAVQVAPGDLEDTGIPPANNRLPLPEDISTDLPPPPDNTSDVLIHPETQFDIGLKPANPTDPSLVDPDPSPLPLDNTVNDVAIDDIQDLPDDGDVVFDYAFGEDGIPPANDDGPVIKFPGELPAVLPATTTEADETESTTEPDVTITGPGEPEITAVVATTTVVEEATQQPTTTEQVTEVEATTTVEPTTEVVEPVTELITDVPFEEVTTEEPTVTTQAVTEVTTEAPVEEITTPVTEVPPEPTTADEGNNNSTGDLVIVFPNNTVAGQDALNPSPGPVITFQPGLNDEDGGGGEVGGGIIDGSSSEEDNSLADEDDVTTTVEPTTLEPETLISTTTEGVTDEELTTVASLVTEPATHAPSTEEPTNEGPQPTTVAASPSPIPVEVTGDPINDDTHGQDSLTTTFAPEEPSTTPSSSELPPEVTTVSPEPSSQDLASQEPPTTVAVQEPEQTTVAPATTNAPDVSVSSEPTTVVIVDQVQTTLAPPVETEAPTTLDQEETTVSQAPAVTSPENPGPVFIDPETTVPTVEEVTTAGPTMPVEETTVPEELPATFPNLVVTSEPSSEPPLPQETSSVAPATSSATSLTTIELFEAPTKIPHPIGSFEEGPENVTSDFDTPELITSPSPLDTSSQGSDTAEMVTTVPIDSMIKPQQCGIHGRYLTLPESRALRINALDYMRGFSYHREPPEARFGVPGARIIGGRVTSTVIWCWMAAFMAKNPGVGQDEFLCSGALIENDLVVSTASCLKKLFDRGLSNFRVVLGDSNLKVNLDIQNNKVVQARDIQEVIIHENYGMDRGIPLNDIGIAKLTQPIDITTTVCLLCLPTEENDYANKYCTVTGYGKAIHDDSSILHSEYIDEFSEGVLRQASLPIMSEGECSASIYNSSRRQSTAVHPSLMCTGAGAGQVACIKSLDAGSPLACHDENGQYVLAGVLSYNLDCGRPLPSLYTRVSTFLRWVRINYMRMLGFIIDNELVKP